MQRKRLITKNPPNARWIFCVSLKRKAVNCVEKAASRIGGSRRGSRLSVIEIVTAAAAAVKITGKQQYYERYAQSRSKGQFVVLIQHGVQQKQIQQTR